MSKLYAALFGFSIALLHLTSLDAQLESCNGDIASIADGYCNTINNNKDCEYDGGDCCECTCRAVIYYCGERADFACVDPDAEDPSLDCLPLPEGGIPPQSALPCTSEAVETWVVEDTASATALAEAINCSGGAFEAEWRGAVNVSDTIHVGGGTTLNVTGDAEAVADGTGMHRMFAVTDGSLHLGNLILKNGFSSTAGGALYSSNSDVALKSVVFDSNSAGYGGAIFAVGSTISWGGACIFSRNNASISGGALFVGNSSASWSGNTMFTSHTAGSTGGVVFATNRSRIWWTGVSVFTNNSVIDDGGFFGHDGGVFYLYHGSSVSWSGETDYTGNTAASYAGVFSVIRGSSVSWRGKTQFAHNNAGWVGGVFRVRDQSTVSWSGNTEFYNNIASYKCGVFHVEDTSSVSWAANTEFVSNFALNYGGGVCLEGGASVSWSGDTGFINNSVSRGGSSSGGVFHVQTGSNVSWSGKTAFTNNSAGNYGGAFLVEEDSRVSWSAETRFSGNSAFSGGAISSLYSATVSWSGETTFSGNIGTDSNGAINVGQWTSITWSADTVFSNNTAGTNGGAIGVSGEANLSWSGDTVFSHNSAGENGGAIVTDTDGLSSISWSGRTDFTKNVAGLDGGAVALYFSLESRALLVRGSTIFSQNTCGGTGGAMVLSGAGNSATFLEGLALFSGNFAGVAGGAVALLSVSFGPAFLGSRFIGNTAQVGGAVYLSASGTAVVADNDYPTSFVGCMFDGNTAEASGGAIESVSGVDIFTNLSFSGNSARVGGALRLAGRATLEECTFRDNASNEGEGPAASSVGFIDSMVNNTFAGNTYLCPKGTFLDFSEGSRFEAVCSACGECQGCSFQNSSVVPVCAQEYDHSISAGGSTTLGTLQLDVGYWRTSETSRKILACYNSAACLGGADSQTYCMEGYTGPYCSVCTEGYAATLVYACTKCSNGDVGMGVTIVLLVFAVLLGASFVAYMVSKDAEDSRWGIVSRLGSRLPRQSLKIVIVAWQIVTQFSSVANIRYPDVYQRFLNYIDVINLDLEWAFAAMCVVDVDFHDRLLVSTLGPLVCACVLGVTHAVAVRLNTGSIQALEKVRQKHVSMAIFVTFLVYSSVSSTVFQMFACDGLDDGKVYLRADYRIDCDSEKHKMLQIYAGFMIAVYPVGIPLIYTILLLWQRGVLEDSAKRKLDSRMQPISDLWKPYKPERFYYEVVECSRRIMLTGVVVFIFPDTAAQVAVTILIGVGFIFLSEILAPFESRWDSWVSRTGHAIVFLSMYMALLLKVDVSEEREESQKIFGAILVAAHICMVLTVVVEAVATACSLKETEEALPRLRTRGVSGFGPLAPMRGVGLQMKTFGTRGSGGVGSVAPSSDGDAEPI